LVGLLPLGLLVFLFFIELPAEGLLRSPMWAGVSACTGLRSRC